MFQKYYDKVAFIETMRLLFKETEEDIIIDYIFKIFSNYNPDNLI